MDKFKMDRKIIIMDESDSYLSISKDSEETMKKLRADFDKSIRKTRLMQKSSFKKAPFPFNMMSNCIDDDGNIKK